MIGSSSVTVGPADHIRNSTIIEVMTAQDGRAAVHYTIVARSDNYQAQLPEEQSSPSPRRQAQFRLRFRLSTRSPLPIDLESAEEACSFSLTT